MIVKPTKLMFRRIHLWTTLIVGLPVALISAAGLPISYWYESDALFAPDYYSGQEVAAPRASFDELARGARSVSGVMALDSLYLLPRFHTAQASVRIRGGRSREVSLDLSSARVIGVRDLDQTAMAWIYGFHTKVLLDRVDAERAGTLLIRTLSICLLALVVTGAWLWWPTRLSWSLFSPTVRRGRVWRDLHLKLGIYVLPILAVVGSSALLLSIEATRELGSRRAVPLPPELAHKSPPETSGASLEALAERGRLRPVAFQVTGLFGIDATAPLAVLSSDLGQERDYWVSVDRATALPVRVSASNPISAGSDITFLIGLHQGHHWGAWGRWIFAVASCITPILYVSGLIMWARRTRRGVR